MDDLFDNGYVVFILVIFLFSIIKNLAKAKKSPPLPPQKGPAPARPMPAAGPAAPARPTAEDFIERKLAELLGLDVPPAPPAPAPAPKPVRPPSFSSEGEKSRTSETRPAGPTREVLPHAASVIKQKPAAMSMRERFIWAEILAPPRARRRGRVI